MKIYDVVNEHKKGFRAKKYASKPKKYIEPVKPVSAATEPQGVAEGDDPLKNREDYAKKHGQGQVYKKTYPGDKHGMTKTYAYDVKRTGPKGTLPKESVEEMYGRKSNYYNPMDYERDQQRQMDYEKRDFKRREMEHELGHEDDPDFERKLRQQQIDRDRGPWYLRINGKILKSQGEPKVFDWKKGANNYALAIIKNKPELQGKIMLTKRAEDDTPADLAETATAGSTSAGNVGVGAIYPNKPPKQPKNKDGTAKNALDMKGTNLLTGGSVKR